MKIEVGKIYKTRCGEKAQIYAVNCGPHSKVHGCFYDEDWILYSWFSDGKVYSTEDEHSQDIIEEWIEPKEMPMKIEVGKFYKTRRGLKVRIYAVDGRSNEPIHGAIERDGEWNVYSWTLGGSPAGCRTDDGEEYPEDIVGEWTESKPKLKAWITASGAVLLFAIDFCEHNLRRAPWLDEP